MIVRPSALLAAADRAERLAGGPSEDVIVGPIPAESVALYALGRDRLLALAGAGEGLIGAAVDDLARVAIERWAALSIARALRVLAAEANGELESPTSCRASAHPGVSWPTEASVRKDEEIGCEFGPRRTTAPPVRPIAAETRPEARGVARRGCGSLGAVPADLRTQSLTRISSEVPSGRSAVCLAISFLKAHCSRAGMGRRDRAAMGMRPSFGASNPSGGNTEMT